MENCNIFEPLVVSLIDVCKVTTRLFIESYNTFKGKENKEYFDFEKYFNIVGLETKHGDNVYTPNLVKKEETNCGTKYYFKIPPGYGEDSLNNYKDGLVSAIGKNIIMTYEGIYWCIEVIEKELPSSIEFELMKYKKNEIKIPLGESLHGVVELDLINTPNTYIVGTTGSGKSVCSKSILTHLVNNFKPYELELYLGDLKRVELNYFRNLKHTKSFVHTVEDVTNLIIFVFEECNRRYELFLELGVSDIYEYNKVKVKKLPYQVLFIEEVVLLLQDKKNVGMKHLKLISSICRACGIFIICTCQRPSSDVLDNVFKSNVGNRIVFQCEDVKNSIIALDDEGAEKLKGRGHGIFKCGANKTEFQGYYLSNEKCKKLIKPFIEEKKTFKKIEVKENKETDFSKYEDVIESLPFDLDMSFLDNL